MIRPGAGELEHQGHQHPGDHRRAGRDDERGGPEQVPEQLADSETRRQDRQMHGPNTEKAQHRTHNENNPAGHSNLRRGVRASARLKSFLVGRPTFGTQRRVSAISARANK